MSKFVLPMFSSKNFIMSGHMFMCLISFELIFVYGVRECSNFILLKRFFTLDIFAVQCCVHFCCTSKWPSHSMIFFFSCYPLSCSITKEIGYSFLLFSKTSLLMHPGCNSLHLVTQPPIPCHSLPLGMDMCILACFVED